MINYNLFEQSDVSSMDTRRDGWLNSMLDCVNHTHTIPEYMEQEDPCRIPNAELPNWELLGNNPDWPDPTIEMLANPEFEAIYQTIKTWDINVPNIDGDMYSGATGNHARAIFDAIKLTRPVIYK